ncbi:hypothetical protein GOZ81_10375 [Agrobacterium vitis]|uniref:hypothetical protein n=1 Tax=Agrobacterium vitis TaxID=373 RepID=UPI0012E920DD|nr:hypothetical protein [Agrobacterium vitis]MVA71480.1 hypothetical protein [Agrobacterium vitis]
MNDNFDRADRRARFSARKALKDGIPPSIVAEAMLVQGLAVWAAETGRKSDAEAILATFVEKRDAA